MSKIVTIARAHLTFGLALACLLVSAYPSCATDLTQTIGTLESHTLLWNKYAGVRSRLRDNRRVQNDNSEKIEQLESKIKDISAHLGEQIDVQKDEFETTSEWRARCVEINEKSKQGKLAEIQRCQTEINKFKSQMSAINEASSVSIPQQTINLPTEIIFLINVRMGSFDADNNSIDGFERVGVSSVEGCPGFVIVGNDYSNPSIFDFEGSSDFKGITISREKAKVLREASDRGVLWIGFKANPKPIEFSDQYTAKNVTKTETIHNDGLDSGQTIAARLFVSALGGDPSGIEDTLILILETRVSGLWVI